MNRKEYERALKATRQSLYRGKWGDALLNVIKAAVAHADPAEWPAPRQLKPVPRLRLGTGKKKQKAGKR